MITSYLITALGLAITMFATLLDDKGKAIKSGLAIFGFIVGVGGLLWAYYEKKSDDLKHDIEIQAQKDGQNLLLQKQEKTRADLVGDMALPIVSVKLVHLKDYNLDFYVANKSQFQSRNLKVHIVFDNVTLMNRQEIPNISEGNSYQGFIHIPAKKFKTEEVSALCIVEWPRGYYVQEIYFKLNNTDTVMEPKLISVYSEIRNLTNDSINTLLKNQYRSNVEIVTTKFE